MDINLYMFNLKLFKGKEDHDGIHSLFLQMLYDISNVDVLEWTEEHFSLAEEGQQHFASLDDYPKAKALKDAITFVKLAQERKRQIDLQQEELDKLKKDNGENTEQ